MSDPSSTKNNHQEDTECYLFSKPERGQIRTSTSVHERSSISFNVKSLVLVASVTHEMGI
ncbi:uncharacterized protein FTOL_13732 [Fusarium torulosum]|uniref:Uncharacterized protein n=1 Tax=Fusarium torulosum TaxID=33205 RepID=A0AAE8MP38_9HYPO|nr:uncharacterized protein FTOL_13732 [Fusarium torulosum]